MQFISFFVQRCVLVMVTLFFLGAQVLQIPWQGAITQRDNAMSKLPKIAPRSSLVTRGTCILMIPS